MFDLSGSLFSVDIGPFKEGCFYANSGNDFCCFVGVCIESECICAYFCDIGEIPMQSKMKSYQVAIFFVYRRKERQFISGN